MASKTQSQIRMIPAYEPNIVEIKAKFECEFRRFSVDRTKTTAFEDFYALVKESHHLPADMPFTISYTDPRNGDLLPITNSDNLLRAYSTAMPLLKLVIYRKQELMLQDMNLIAKKHKRGMAPAIANQISPPQDFRVVSSIVDADMLPDTVRRVKLWSHPSDPRPRGFFIRDGFSIRVTPYGLEKVPGIYISRLVPGGLAEGTGLLGVNDEILEVNGIDVVGKSLDQVTDIMLANSRNLVVTVKPASEPPSTPQPRKQAATGGVQNIGDIPSITATPPTHSTLDPVPLSHSNEQNSMSTHDQSAAKLNGDDDDTAPLNASCDHVLESL